jgi:hypothetical protein
MLEPEKNKSLTYLILKKAIALNKTKLEHKAILKRMHFESFLAYQTANYSSY